jgi:hypothetical protein
MSPSFNITKRTSAVESLGMSHTVKKPLHSDVDNGGAYPRAESFYLQELFRSNSEMHWFPVHIQKMTPAIQQYNTFW